MNDRQYLEEQIIGMALQHEGLAVTAMDIVGPANFQNQLCKEIAEIFNILIKRNTIIDIVSVTLAHRRNFKDTSPYAITNLADKSVGISLKDKCLVLLQIDIKQKALEICIHNENKASKAQQFEVASVWKQCHDHLASPDIDILEQLPAIQRYAASYSEDGAEELALLVDAIPKVAKRINNVDRLKHSLNVLQVIGNQTLNRERQHCLSMIKDIIIHTVTAKELPANFYNYINELNKSINESNHT